jgi:hypothetical protein
VEEGEDVMLPGLGRARPVPLDPIHVLDMLVEFSNWLEHVGSSCCHSASCSKTLQSLWWRASRGVAGVLLEISLGSAALKGLGKLS